MDEQLQQLRDELLSRIGKSDKKQIRSELMKQGLAVVVSILMAVGATGILVWREQGIQAKELAYIRERVSINATLLENNRQLISEELGRTFTEHSRERGLYALQGEPRLTHLEHRVATVEKVLPELLALLSQINKKLEEMENP